LDESNCQLEADSSNDDLTIHVNSSQIDMPDNFRFEAQYAGTGDVDASGIVLYDKSENRWWTASITNGHGVNGIGYIEGGDVNSVQSGKNFDTTSSHEFAIEYNDGMMQFYVDDVLSASYDIGVKPDSIGFLSDAQNPPAVFDSYRLLAPDSDKLEVYHYGPTGGSATWTAPSNVNSVDVLLVGGGGGMGYTGSDSHTGGDGGDGLVVIRYNSEFCNERGPKKECIMNIENNLNSQTYDVKNFFDVRKEATLRSNSGVATLNISNSSSISGLWEGGFNIISSDVVLKSGAEFRPNTDRIIIGN